MFYKDLSIQTSTTNIPLTIIHICGVTEPEGVLGLPQHLIKQNI